MIDGLLPITDEQAKLGQEIVKAFRGLGSFLERALGSTPEDLIAYLGGDWLRVRRAENLVKLFEEARRRLADRNVKEPIPASLSVALPILQSAADEDREELRRSLGSTFGMRDGPRRNEWCAALVYCSRQGNGST
jgi:hypothetical protein